jgi:hypothetical protein
MVGLHIDEFEAGTYQLCRFHTLYPSHKHAEKLKVDHMQPETGYTILWVGIVNVIFCDSVALALDAMGCGAPRAGIRGTSSPGCAPQMTLLARNGWPLPASGWLTGWLD